MPMPTPASQCLESLKQWFDASRRPLADDEDVLMIASSCGRRIVVGKIGCLDPEVIRFTGLDEDENQVAVFQHVSQMDVMLKFVKRDPAVPRKTIGFISVGNDEKSA